jgi:hypothetical protein
MLVSYMKKIESNVDKLLPNEFEIESLINSLYNEITYDVEDITHFSFTTLNLQRQ